MIRMADLFCGAGGTSTGAVHAIRKLGLDIDLTAINHWSKAIETHAANHPGARHLCESLDNVDPRKLFPGGYLDLLVASPECTHHSIARGGRPINDQSRASAWHVLRWAEALYIENILVENVPEFITWGPLDKDGRPIKSRKGETFLAFIQALRSLGYNVEHRVLNAADYGDPTTRQRLFILARRSNPVRWPEPTHSRSGDLGFLGSHRRWKAARDVIDWSIPGESIFTRKKPLAENTMRRIRRGLERFGGYPFVIGQQSCSAPRGVDQPVPTVAAAGAISLVEPFLVEYHGDDRGRERIRSLNDPLPTQDTSNRFALCQPYIVALNHGQDDCRSYSLDAPMPTITSVDAWGLVEPFLVRYNGTGAAVSVDEPMPTLTAKDRFGLVIPLTDGGQAVVDIRFRMLQPHELAAAMSFPADYRFAGNRSERVKQIGNAVPGRVAEALVTALLQ